MPTNDRRAAARRRAWGRGPKILRFEPLEGRQLLSAAGTGGPDLIPIRFQSDSTADWGAPVQVQGTIQNQGDANAKEAFQIDVYVSSAPKIGDAASVKIGTVEVDEGLKAFGELSDRNEDSCACEHEIGQIRERQGRLGTDHARQEQAEGRQSRAAEHGQRHREHKAGRLGLPPECEAHRTKADQLDRFDRSDRHGFPAEHVST